jgi:ferredoxin-NADP reductase
MSMLRHLDRTGAMRDVAHLHSARGEEDLIFGDELRALDRKHDDTYRLHIQWTGEQGRLDPDAMQELCPDWRGRETYA